MILLANSDNQTPHTYTQTMFFFPWVPFMKSILQIQHHSNLNINKNGKDYRCSFSEVERGCAPPTLNHGIETKVGIKTNALCFVFDIINVRFIDITTSSPINVIYAQMSTGLNGEKDITTYLCNKDYCNSGDPNVIAIFSSTLLYHH